MTIKFNRSTIKVSLNSEKTMIVTSPVSDPFVKESERIITSESITIKNVTSIIDRDSAQIGFEHDGIIEYIDYFTVGDICILQNLY